MNSRKSIYAWFPFKSGIFLKSGFIFLLLLLVYSLPCYADWKKSDVGFTFATQDKLMIGEGRDDGIKRIYSGDCAFGAENINEFSFSTDHWETVSFGGDLTSIEGIAIGNCRNDGVKRLYASGYNVAEYYYS